MGYVPEYFGAHVAHWLEEGWLPPGGRLLDLGAQEIVGEGAEVARQLADFLAVRGVAVADLLGEDGCYAIARVFAATGITYTSIDVDGQLGSLFFDLNSEAAPPEWRGHFDFVNNEGTTEHLVNPINALHVAHEVLKVGGIARHSVPLTGWGDHGLIYPTTKFWALLMDANRYQQLEAYIEVKAARALDQPPRFAVRAEAGFPQVCDAWLHLTYRKTGDADFAIPVDHILVPDVDAVVKLLRTNHDRLAARRLPAMTATTSVVADLGLVGAGAAVAHRAAVQQVVDDVVVVAAAGRDHDRIGVAGADAVLGDDEVGDPGRHQDAVEI
jgi:hypothetical protein